LAVEVYIPDEVDFAGERCADAAVVTLYDPDGDNPCGALTGPNPLSSGRRGALTFTGARDGQTHEVSLQVIEVTNRSAMGCEFRIVGEIVRKPMREAASIKAPTED
jgi:hypothetical protein